MISSTCSPIVVRSSPSTSLTIALKSIDLRLDDLATSECQQLVRQSRCTLGGGADLAHIIKHRSEALALVRRTQRDLRGDLLVDEADVVEDRREQVVEVVRDAAGELTEALEPLRLMELAFEAIALELRLHAIAFVLCFDALGHIANCGADQQSLLCLDGGERHFGRELGTVVPASRKRDPRLAAMACADLGILGWESASGCCSAAPGTSNSTGRPINWLRS